MQQVPIKDVVRSDITSTMEEETNSQVKTPGSIDVIKLIILSVISGSWTVYDSFPP